MASVCSANLNAVYKSGGEHDLKRLRALEALVFMVEGAVEGNSNLNLVVSKRQAFCEKSFGFRIFGQHRDCPQMHIAHTCKFL